MVEPAPGVAADDALAERLLVRCAERPARSKLSKSIDYTTEMPRDPGGKLCKRKLRDPDWEGRTWADLLSGSAGRCPGPEPPRPAAHKG